MNRFTTRFMNLLASAALVAALAPVAANAATMTSLDYVRIAAHEAISGPMPEVQHIATTQGTGQTVVLSGGVNQLYPDSVGG